MSQSSEDLIRSLYEAFGRGDIPSILSAVSEDISMHSPSTLPQGGEFHGREEAARFFEGIGLHWDSLSVDVDDLLSAGDQVVVIGTAHGRLRSGDDAGYGATHVWTLRDGTPVSFHEYVDTSVAVPAAG